MLFDLNGNTYQIKFSRSGDETRAILYIIDGNNNLYPLEHARSVRKHQDIFNKSIGRKRSLANLLKRSAENTVFPRLSKEDRNRIWEIYFKEHKK